MDREPTRPDDVLHLTFRGIDIREETIWYVRSLCQRLGSAMSPRARFEVTLERRDGSPTVQATVRTLAGRGPVEAVVQVDRDELRAVRDAFDALGERLNRPTAPVYA